MIKLFDDLNQGTTEISDRIKSVKSHGPYVSVSFDIRGVRMDHDNNYMLPPRRGPFETMDDFRKRMDMFVSLTRPIIDPSFRRDMAGNVTTKPVPNSAACEFYGSSAYQIRVALWIRDTTPVFRSEQSFDHSPGEAYKNWYNLLRLSRTTGGVADACKGAARLEEMYRMAMFETLEYLIRRDPANEAEYNECKRRMRVNLMNKVVA